MVIKEPSNSYKLKAKNPWRSTKPISKRMTRRAPPKAETNPIAIGNQK